jgi:hypothetical protein
MCWGVISKKERIALVFIDRGVKINSEYYKTEVLEKNLLQAAISHSKRRSTVF